MTTFFSELGERIARAWSRDEYREAQFPSICTSALFDARATRYVGVDALIEWAFACGRMPRQVDVDSEFGEPPLTVYENDRFHISVLFWLEGTTAIHEHGFCGAFQVLHGSSLHTTFRFEPKETISDHLLRGTLVQRHVERLEAGDVRPILSAEGTVHSLFHLERPSATIVVRTYYDSRSRPQYSYCRSGVAWNPFYDRAELKRRVQLMRLVQDIRPHAFAEHCMQWIGNTDFVSAFMGLRKAMTLLSPEEGSSFLERANQIRPDVVGTLRDTIIEDRRQAALIRRRATVTDPELRFFLAVLLNVRGRENALRLIGEKFSERSPVDSVIHWVHELARLPSPFVGGASALGFPLDDVVVAALRALLESEPFEGLVGRISSHAKRPLTEVERRDLAQLCEALWRNDMFRYLLE